MQRPRLARPRNARVVELLVATSSPNPKGAPEAFPAGACAIGIDVGGTKIAAGLLQVCPDGRRVSVLAREAVATSPNRGGRAVLEDVLRLGHSLVTEAGARGARPHAFGVGLCELIDQDGRVASANCIDWQSLPVRMELERVAPTATIALEADVRAAARAEGLLGAGRNRRVFVYVTIGTGISCCLMLDGHPFLGARGATGTMASSRLWIPSAGEAGPTLEEVASGPALVQRFQETGGRAATGHDVLAAVRAGDPAATQVVRSAAEALAAQLAIVVGALDPEILVVGGGLGLSEGPYWDWFTTATRRRIWADCQRDLPIVRATTGAEAGWQGAALAALVKSAESPYHPLHDH